MESADRERADAASAPRRGRGRRAGLDRERIVQTARGMDPDALTMQAVADQLGVDRKALNHHVTDRDGLLELLAIDAFLARFSAIAVPVGAGWEDACRALATGLRESVEATGSLVLYFRFTTQRDLAAVGPAEVVLRTLLDAGFDEVTAGRGLHLLITISLGFARDAVMNAREGGHPQVAELRRMLTSTVEGYDAIRHLLGTGIDSYGDAQFAFDLDAFLTSMRARLPAGR